MELDEAQFHKQMDEQRRRARKAREALGDLGWAGVEFGKDVPETEFVGYDRAVFGGAKIVALVVENEQAEELMPGVEGIVVLDKTPFYAEMGGQVGDHGQIVVEGDHPARFVVTDVQKNKGGKYMHYGKLVEGTLKLGDAVRAEIDTGRRHAIMRAHSATHLLDKALRTVLGDHVHQAGSLVEEDRLRFDFTHFSALTPEEIAQVSAVVNEAILAGYGIHTDVLPLEEAKKRGAIALFGEKYGDTVRVVDMGEGYSVEFCGGTHLDNTAKVGPFRILSEASVAAGVRRIEALTGKAALSQVDQMSQLIGDAAAILKTTPQDLLHKAASTVQDLKEMRQRVDRLKDKLFSGEIERTLFSAKEIKGVKVFTMTRSDIGAEDLRKMGDFVKDRAPNCVALMAAVNDGKITLLAACGKNAIARGIKAGDVIKNLAPICGGKGGGKPDSAMGGGTDVLKLDDCLAALDDYVDAHVKE